jgi:hypothetical protein
LWLALSLESVEWSGRARMISLAQWLGLVSASLLWLGLRRDSTRHRLAFAASYGLTLLSHFAMVVLMPAWLMATAVLWRLKLVQVGWPLVRDGLVAGLCFGLAISSGILFQPPPSVEFQTGPGGLDSKVGELNDKFLQIPSDLGHAWAAYGPYFLDLPHGPVLIAALVGLAASLVRLRGGRRLAQDMGALYLGIIFVTVIGVLSLIIDPHWQRARYLLMQLQGVFLLLGAHGCREIVGWIASVQPGRRLRLRWPAGALLVLALAGLFVPPLKDIVEGDRSGWERYDLAFGYVKSHLNEADKVMTMHPPASLLYLDRSDYYLVQESPKLIVRADGTLGDRYSGAAWLDSAEAFSQLLAGPERVWLVAPSRAAGGLAAGP